MKINELKGKAPVEEITMQIESVDEPREVRGGSLRVANATGKDETGTIIITLWNDDIEKVKTGDTIKITKGWVNEYQGQLQLSSGKFGKIEVLESSGEAPQEESEEKPKEKSDVDFAVDEDII